VTNNANAKTTEQQNYIVLYDSYLGKIISPSDGTELTLLPGSSRNISWTFDDGISTVSGRTWIFASYYGLRSGTLGGITSPFPLQVTKNVLPGINIILPGTLELNNVSHSFDGNYTFSILTTDLKTHTSKVLVYIASKFHSYNVS
jgi:hypothetical protein